MTKCLTCKFNKPIDDHQGECRRNSPILMLDPVRNVFVWNFPGVHLQETWCGEWIEKEGSKPI